MASGIPSSFRQMSTTAGTSTSLQPEVAENVRCALDEQLNGREIECLGSTETV
jgi:hypothetical protein